jgi:predicted SprT family Zn-dependent metalloprotease
MNRETKILRMIYRELNTKAFNGKLPMCDIQYVNLPNENWYATFYFYMKPMTIVINKPYIENRVSMLKETILHEMVHVWQYVKDKEMLHNKSFFRMLRKACKDANIAFDERYFQHVKKTNYTF